MAVRFDNGLGGHDGDVAEHQRPQTVRGGDVGLERERGVHDDAVLVEEPEGGAVGECRDGMAESGNARPTNGNGADGVVSGRLDEEAIAYGSQSGQVSKLV